MRISLLCALLFAICFSGCKKDKDDNSSPDSLSVISFFTPTPNATYFVGSALRIRGEITDLNGLNFARVEVKNKTTGTALYQQQSVAGSATYYGFDWTWNVSGISSNTPATVKVTARDLRGNEVFKEIDITLTN